MQSMPSVADVERLATLLYVEGKPIGVAESSSGVAIPNSPDSIDLLKSTISSSTASVAVFFASQLLKRILQDTCNCLTSGQLEELATFLTDALQLRGLSLEAYVVGSLVSNLAFVVVQGLLESDALSRFPISLAVATRGDPSGTAPPYAPLVLVIFESIVIEVGQLNPRRTLAIHRRIATAFRDTCLLDIFSVSIECVEFVYKAAGNASPDFMLAAFRLARSALSYDFVCMFPDDSEDSPTASIPATWRPLLCKPGFFDMFWSLFENLPAPFNVVVLQCLIQLGSARRSLFQCDEERKLWLQRIMRGTMDVIERHVWLSDEEILREFCRLLNRLKPNYQLNELLEVEFYESWVRRVAEFTVQCFGAWRATKSSFLSLCCMWARLLGSQEFSRKDKDPLFDELMPHVTRAYVNACMEMGEAFGAGNRSGLENPLDDDSDALRLELEFASQMIRGSLSQLSTDIISLFKATVEEYGICVGNRRPSGILEEKLSWLLFLLGSLCKTPPHTECENDALLILHGLNAVQVESDRLVMDGLQSSPSILHLELACLHFLHNFRKTYARDPSTAAAKVLAALQDKLSLRDFSSSEFQQRILLYFITKIVCNLRHWTSSQHVLNLTLVLFTELASAFSSGKHLLGLDPVRSLLSAGETAPFPFQHEVGHHRVRVKYFRTLASIFFLENVTSTSFSRFLQAAETTLANVRLALTNDASVLADVAVRETIVGCFCDLRGVASSCLGRRHFHLLFEFLAPAHLETIRAFVWHVDNSDLLMEVQALRLAGEICYNRCQRIHFETHSIGGISLFRFLSSIVCCLGKRVCERVKRAQHQLPGDMQHWVIKETYVLCALGYRGLTGGYCNFGVFELYQDPVLRDMLGVLWGLMGCFSFEDVRVYPKLAIEYFQLLGQVFAEHPLFYASQAPFEIIRLLHMLEASLRTPSLPQQAYSASFAAVEALASLLVDERRKQAPTLAQLVASHDADFFDRLLAVTLNSVLTDDGPHQALLCAPLYSLMLLCPQAFDALVSKILSNLAEEKHDAIRSAFEKLLNAIPAEADAKPPDAFGKSLTALRNVAKSIL